MSMDYRDPAIRVSLLPKDTNAHGTIFGGIILSYIDTGGAVGAHRLGIRRLVTVAMNGVQFHEPVFVGDIISIYTWPTRIGRTSITIHVVVVAERAHVPDDGSIPSRIRVTEAEVVYVAVGEDRKPISIEHLRDRVDAMIQVRHRAFDPTQEGLP